MRICCFACALFFFFFFLLLSAVIAQLLLLLTTYTRLSIYTRHLGHTRPGLYRYLVPWAIPHARHPISWGLRSAVLKRKPLALRSLLSTAPREEETKRGNGMDAVGNSGFIRCSYTVI
jgi:hypothetical protein